MTIIPDTKDWTWVLRRPCPECGFDTQGFPVAAVPGMIMANVAAWQAALDALAPDEALAAQLWDYLVMAAHSLVNVDPAHGRPDLGLRPA